MGCFCCGTVVSVLTAGPQRMKSNVSQCCGLWRFCAWRMADRADCGLRSPERETYRCAASIHIVALFCWAVEQKPRLVRASTPQTGGYVLLPPRRRPACTFVAKRREKRDDLLVGSHDADGELNWKKEQRHGAVAGARWVPVTEVFFFCGNCHGRFRRFFYLLFMCPHDEILLSKLLQLMSIVCYPTAIRLISIFFM